MNIKHFEEYLASNIAEQMEILGERAKELDWYAGNLFPEEDKE